MKFTKTHALILSAVVIIAVIYFLFFRKKSAPESSFAGFIVPGVPAFPKTRPVTGPGLGKVKYVGTITNTKKPCPQGSHSVKNADGSYGCVQNVS